MQGGGAGYGVRATQFVVKSVEVPESSPRAVSLSPVPQVPPTNQVLFWTVNVVSYSHIETNSHYRRLKPYLTCPYLCQLSCKISVDIR